MRHGNNGLGSSCLLLLSALAGGCGDSSDDGEQGAAMLPLVVGARWTYLVTEVSGATSDKTQTVLREVVIDDSPDPVLELETDRDEGRRTVSYQQQIGVGVVRYREESYGALGLAQIEVYEPYKLRVPAGLGEPGASLTQSFQDSAYAPDGSLRSVASKSEVWSFEAIETVTVPAGEFERAIRLRRVSQASDKTYWFVEGVGKVREDGAGQREELRSYEVP